MEHAGHTYPAGAVCEGKLLICETKQFVCKTSEAKNQCTLRYALRVQQAFFQRDNLHVRGSNYICKITYASNPIE